MSQDPRVGITMYPGPPSPPWGEGRRTEEVGWSQFRSSQETCLLPGDRPKLTPVDRQPVLFPSSTGKLDGRTSLPSLVCPPVQSTRNPSTCYMPILAAVPGARGPILTQKDKTQCLEWADALRGEEVEGGWRGISGRLKAELSMGRCVYRASGVWLCVPCFRNPKVNTQWCLTEQREEGILGSCGAGDGGKRLSILQQECISKIYNQVQKDPNWIYSMIPLLLMYVCTPMKPNRKAHSKLLTLPRTNALQRVNPPTGNQKHIFIHTCTLTCDTVEAMDKCMDKEDSLNPHSITSQLWSPQANHWTFQGSNFQFCKMMILIKGPICF